MGLRIAMGVVVLLFLASWWAAFTGFGLPTTAAVEAQRQAILSRRSVRLGYSATGPHYGK